MLYTVKYLGNVEDGNPVLYLNVDIGQIKELIEKSIMDNKGVWFGCDVGQHLHRNNYAMDLELVDYSLLDADLISTKEERLLYKESLMTHAMCITDLIGLMTIITQLINGRLKTPGVNQMLLKVTISCRINGLMNMCMKLRYIKIFI